MIWHQILLNGLQSTVLTLVAVVLSLVLIEEAILTTIAVVARTTGASTVLSAATTTVLSGVHFICNLESEVRSLKPEVGYQKTENRKSTI